MYVDICDKNLDITYYNCNLTFDDVTISLFNYFLKLIFNKWKVNYESLGFYLKYSNKNKNRRQHMKYNKMTCEKNEKSNLF